ncbi:hypothetical protein [Sporolactobacillus spathodeae]|uniref:Uncharacterized protein n=1 Tax=Sporolactobacillus spathodeae TaxID=1465502 RepID=A0ABS2QA61_9BACL|nr:hypothetical protein [Sporolactobacillus spathodeae]MBM7658667.1 hypothetical protein [Sporolactobacillus spathodeae]
MLMDVERLEDYIELYLNVVRNSPWNELWKHAADRQRLLGMIHTPSFLGFALGKRIN